MVVGIEKKVFHITNLQIPDQANVCITNINLFWYFQV